MNSIASLREIESKYILENYIEMWDSLAVTGKVSCFHFKNYVIVNSNVDDPGFNILIPKDKISKTDLDFIKKQYKEKRNNFTIMSPMNYLEEVKEQLAPFFIQEMYGLVRETYGNDIFNNELSKELSFVETFENSFITRNWKNILKTSFSMTNSASQQFVNILSSYNKIVDNFNHTVTYINGDPASICSILYSKNSIHAGLYNGASLSKHPMHKPFVSIINKHINDAFNNGYKWVISQSTPIAANALKKYLGFTTLDIYSYYKVLI